jgi:putative nucleotidyltransferase with HDIG domain
MTNRNFSTILRQIDSFPALPTTVSAVMAVTGNPNSSARELMRAILPDQAMCSTILKIANSAFFGLSRKVATIDKAVIVLGFDEIRNVVLGKAIFSSFQKLNKNNKENIALFWEHSFTCGLAAKIIAEDLGLSPSELFVAGLLHDIGKLALLLIFPVAYQLLVELSEPHKFRTAHEEQKLYATSHDQVGMMLLNRWMLPEQLLMAAGYHHQPELAPGLRVYPIIVQMADMLTLMHCNPDRLDPADVVTIFADFLPESTQLWLDNGLPWNPGQVGKWFAELIESRKNDQAVLDILTS